MRASKEAATHGSGKGSGPAKGEAPAPPPDAPLPDAAPGATANSPWSLPKDAWIQIIKRVWVMTGFHEIALLAAGVAFFSFLALTPLIAATVMIYGLLGDVGTVRAQMAQLVSVMPPEAAHLLEDQLIGVVTTSAGVTGIALVVALAFAIYGGMRAASGMIGALNIINEEHETRGILKLTWRATALTLATVMIALTGLVGGSVFAWLQTRSGVLLGPFADVAFKLLTWGAAIALGSVGFAMIMRFGPDRSPAKWRWLTPGSVVATVLWLAVSFGFSLYVATIGDYNATYGSLTAVVVFLMWLYLSAYGVLIGATLNAEIERQTICDTTTGPARPIGRRGAVLADQIDASVPGLAQLEQRRRRHGEHARRADAESDSGVT